ncbi:MAG TPA: hypothetical protein VK154_01205 [Chitinophagales bacterium]|nr:hypothetical protein [Chitinophagales bacterium]
MVDSNYILVSNVQQRDIETAVANMAVMHADNGYTKSIEIYRYPVKGLFLLLFPFPPDFEWFQYIVNYLKYPEGVTYNADVRGYWTLKKGDGALSEHIGKRVMLYVSDNDKEYDNVALVTDDKLTYRLDFSGIVTLLPANEKEFIEIEVSMNDFAHVINIVPDKEEVKKLEDLKQRKGCLFLMPLLGLISWLF